MQIVYCSNCADVFLITSARIRKCLCGQSWAQYDENDTVRLSPSPFALVIDLNDSDLNDAAKNRSVGHDVRTHIPAPFGEGVYSRVQ